MEEASEDVGSVPGLGRSPGERNGNPPQYSCLWAEEPGGLQPAKIKSLTVSTVSPSVCHEVMGPDAMILLF